MNPRNAIAFGHDLAATAFAWVAGFMLRFNLDVPEPWWSMMWSYLGWVLPLQAVILWRLRLYQGIWRFASVTDLRRIVVAAIAGGAAMTAVVVVFGLREIPRTVIVIYPVLLAVVMGASRFGYRMWKEGRLFSPRQLDARRVVILGAGDSGAALARTLAGSRDLVVVGFLDDDASKTGSTVGGVPVLGPLADLPQISADLDIAQAIIAMPGTRHRLRRRAFEIAADAGIPAYAVPAFADLAAGKVQVSQLHRVELDDLLGRDPVTLDDAGLTAFLGGRTVLVTGAGGSIGSELCRQIARFNPARLVFVETSEFALYNISEEFARRFPELPVAPLIADVKDAARLAAIFEEHRPAVVFHAAAYKHVPLMEERNAWEAVRNNVLGTARVAAAAIDAGAEAFVLISTDKAVNPTNVMGASKRAAELACQAIRARGRTRFITVRFGNVLGSNGSVVPKFRQQIAAGGPITVTHPEVTRYFMLIPEAAQLVLQAGAMGSGGEIFVLDMGEPVKIVDLARDMIRLSGLSADEVKIVFTGLRPGEKLYEEVLLDDETTLPTPHAKLRIARVVASADAAWLAAALAWLDSPEPRTDAAVREMLVRWIPEYRPAP
jgi:FlaA1/EpsC-like NDP-sugar epimerase